MMKNIIFFDTKDYEITYFQKFLGNKFNLYFEKESLHSDSKIPDIAMNAEIISVFTTSRLTKAVLKKFKNLRLIATRSVGYSHIDLDYCKENNIKIVNTPHYGDYTVAEYSFGLLINLVRKIDEARDLLKNGNSDFNYAGMELFEKTIGIIGTGGIGSKAVKIANGFSMKVLAFDIHKNRELEEYQKFMYVDFDTLLNESDIIALYAPANKENYHLIGSEQINKMKDNVIIINTARGELIDTNALYSALKSGKIKGAALDVLECEEVLTRDCDYFKDGVCTDLECLKRTLINHKLLSFDNVIITPHIAYDTKEATRRIMELTSNNIIAFSINYNIENEVF